MQLNPNLALICMGLVAVVALAVLAYAQQARKSELAAFIEPFQGVLEQAFKRFDDFLSQYGAPLKPVNELVTATATLIDDPNDFLAQLLPDAIEAGVRKALDELKLLTDGRAARQAAPLQPVTGDEHAAGPLGETVPYQLPASDGMPGKQ